MNELQWIPLATIDGSETTLGEYAGKVLLVVNVASKCGLTPQYEALEELYEQRRDEGFVVLGFPANNLGEQEPGTDAEIAQFCHSAYRVRFWSSSCRWPWPPRPPPHCGGHQRDASIRRIPSSAPTRSAAAAYSSVSAWAGTEKNRPTSLHTSAGPSTTGRSKSTRGYYAVSGPTP